MTARRLVITGRVQGVGYRYWMREVAEAAGASGWVRNRRDGSVEAVVAGDDGAIDMVIAACRQGPPGAVVADVAVTIVAEEPAAGFAILPSA